MRKINSTKLEAGMITAERVFSKKGQLIVEKNTYLTAQMISHILYYEIPFIKIIDGVIPLETIAAINLEQSVSEAYSARVKSSAEYQLFKRKYNKNVSFIENSLNEMIFKNTSVNTNLLLSETVHLLSKNTTTISTFDMLHNMRRINDSTYAHSLNVAIISRMIGIWMDYSSDDLDTLTMSGLLHDIGKCKINPRILNKPDKLTAKEYREIQKHPMLGYKIIKNFSIDERIKLVALQHHESCDGTGYPNKLTHSQIEDFASIVSIADVYDAMTSDRCYRPGLCPFEVIAAFESDGFSKYKPQFLTTFLERIANTYINNEVLLNNGQTGKIVMINNQYLTRPMIQLHNNEFVNLLQRPDLYIQAII